MSATPIICGQCRACCINDKIPLGETDHPSAFKWHLENGRPVLDRKVDGSCIYLDERGCTIHGRAPAVCQRFDCRDLFLTTPKTKRRIRIQQNPSMVAVYRAGKIRLDTSESIT